MTRSAWFSKNCVVTLERDGASSTTVLTGKTTSFDEGGGEKATDYVNVFGGGQISKENRQEPFEVTLEIIPTNTTDFEPLYGAASTESSVSVVKSTEIDFTNHRVTLTWADGFDSSTPKVPNSGEALRFTYIDAKAATVAPSEDADGELVASLTFSVGATNSDGTAMIVKEYTDNAATKPFGVPYGRGGVRQAFNSYT